MGRRLGQLTGLLAITMVILRLDRLLQSGPDIVQWELILIASVFLGAVIWWLLDQLTVSRPLMLSLFIVGGLVLMLRISVPGSLIAGAIPSLQTPGALAVELTDALRTIRSGVPPVLPTEGIVGILAMVMWGLGALYSWGLYGGPVAAMSLPAIVVYLQFAVFDRLPAGPGWMTVAAAVLALAIASVALDRRAETGRARDTEGRALPRRSLAGALTTAGVLALTAIVTTTSASGLVPQYGNIPWRTGGLGYGTGSGRVAIDRFVDLRQSLISRSNTVVFEATLGADAPPASSLYWRLETLDQFDGVTWRRTPDEALTYDPDQDVGAAHHRYQGSTADVLQKVRVRDLSESRVPIAGVATEIHRLSEQRAIDPQAFRVAADSSIVYPPVLREGDIYQVRATYPDRESDLGMLATGPTGELSPIFAGAVEEGVLELSPDPTETEVTEPPDLDFYRELPEENPATLRGIAAVHTNGATTDFERAWMLQHWFRDSGEFMYSTDVSTGHDALRLDEWLNDPASTNYRTGYCEQFAAAMAVLGRNLGIPSRVVLGFTPGRVTDDGVIQVRDTNAHAWVEMWMPCCGWVPFDPTPRGDSLPQSITASFDPETFAPDVPFPPGLGEPIDPSLVGEGGTGIVDLPPVGSGQGAARWWPLLIPAVALGGSVVPLLKWMRRRRRLRRARHGDVTAVWEEIVDRLIDLGEPVPASLTPLELARATDDALLPLAVSYSAAIYGGREGQGSDIELMRAESWLANRYDGGHRIKASLSLRSLMD